MNVRLPANLENIAPTILIESLKRLEDNLPASNKIDIETAFANGVKLICWVIEEPYRIVTFSEPLKKNVYHTGQTISFSESILLPEFEYQLMLD